MTVRLFLVAGLLSALLGVGAWCALPALYDGALSAPREVDPHAWIGSTSCRACHPDHYRSWHRTFHRTMTQAPTDESVLGAFDGSLFVYRDARWRPVRTDDGFAFEVVAPSGETAHRYPVVHTVGSRRYQQYVVNIPQFGTNLYRFPLLWHREEARWIHMNGAFLDRDGAPIDKHLALWNQNCIFCHNTGPVPGYRNADALAAKERRGEAIDVNFDARYESHVAERGIACEACHGPAAAHVEANRDPGRRYALHASGRADPTVVNPARLDKTRSVQLCGQCHGQRLPAPPGSLGRWLVDGPPYRAGDDLAAVTKPVFRDTPVPGVRAHERDTPLAALFRDRFWGDGTPRLTAYEYQGILRSPCHERGELTCLSCHAMHGADTHGQLAPGMRSHRACTQCHQAIARDIAAHTHHAPDSAGSDCFACHMPHMTYGIMTVHRSHRIESPDVARDVAGARPNACTACHLDLTPADVHRQMSAWWGPQRALPAARGDRAPLAAIDWLAALHAGGPVQRAVAAWQAGETANAPNPRARGWTIPHLLIALEDDYPAIRRFAWRSLRALDAALDRTGVGVGLDGAIAGFDFMAPPAERRALIDAARARWRAVDRSLFGAPPAGALLDAAFAVDRSAVNRLRRLQAQKTIEIGE